MIRFAEEEESETSSPHLVAAKVDQSFVFTLRAEGSDLYGNMNMVDGLAAFLHICFVMNMHYPKVELHKNRFALKLHVMTSVVIHLKYILREGKLFLICCNEMLHNTGIPQV